MRYILLLLVLTITRLGAQSPLTFDKRFVECEDRWVAFRMNKDSTYNYGFIYIDAQAGLTFQLEGNFKITSAGRFIPHRIDSTSIKMRLQPNNVQVAFIPESKYAELEIPVIPDWLQYYKTDTATAERQYRWGFMYNGWDQCARALTYLERAKNINPDFPGLRVELAYSYNCLGHYEQAIGELEAVLKTDPTDAYVNKELIYALTKSKQLDKAAEACRKAIKLCADQTYNGENCYNLLHHYYLEGDKVNFRLWLKETKKWAAKNEKMMQSISTMEKNLL